MATFSWKTVPPSRGYMSGAVVTTTASGETSAEANELSQCAVLIVDTEAARFQGVRKLLKNFGCAKVYFAPGPAEACELYTTLQPDLVILQVQGLAHQDLHSFVQVQAVQPIAKRSPILMVADEEGTMNNDPSAIADAFKDTVVDLLAPGSTPDELRLRIQNLLRVRGLVTRLHRQQEWLEQAVIARTRSLQGARREVLERLALAAQYRDDGTGDHTRRVGYLSARTAQAMNLEPAFVEAIGSAALLHDLGKIGLPDAILHKPGPLTVEEFEIVKQHPRIGAEILEGCVEPILQMAREIALAHHERFDGSGYPSNLVGTEIPLSGRIVAVCDVYDALTRDRVYRPAMPYEVALQMIVDGSGTEFDPEVVEAFCAISDALPDMEAVESPLPKGTGYLSPG
jgi:putative two-component system response regulator